MPRFHVRVADRAQEDRVHLPQTRELVVGQRVPGPQVALATQIELDELDIEPLDTPDGVDDLQALAHDLRSGPVAGDHPDLVRHGMTSTAGSTGSCVLATPERTVDRGQVRAGARLYDVHRDATAGDPPSVDVELHDHVP